MSARSVERTGAGQYVGRYRILAPIGIGSSATVYRALDEDSATEVAVKVLADNYSLVPEMRRRFLDEIALLMSVRNPAVAQVYGHGETESGQPYMVLELADRGDLGHRVASLGSQALGFASEDVLALAEALATALSALHDVGIVHRDTSPGNILIGTDPGGGSATQPGVSTAGRGRVLRHGERYLLADLGFAKDMQRASGLTAGGGTRGFAAPEQRQEVAHIDHRVDIFGATAVIDWLLDHSALRSRIEPFLQTGMSPDPDLRHRSMEEWLAALRRSLDGGGPDLAGAVAPAAATGPPSQRGGERKRLVPIGVLAVVGLAVVGLAVAGGLTIRSRPSDQVEQPLVASPALSQEEVPIVEVTGPTTLPELATSLVPTVTIEPTTPVESTTTAESTDTIVPTTATESTIESTATSGTAAPPSSTVTTIDPRFEFSPRAFVAGPAADSIVDGDLRISGTAEYREGITGVKLVIRREEDDHVWYDSTQSFNREWAQLLVKVTPVGETEVTWSYTVSKAHLRPGRYMIRAWAVGTDANDPISDRRFVSIAE